MTGRIVSVQPFSLHDGPGTRTTVFLQGCPLRCLWCHNPESQPASGALLFYPRRCVGCGECAGACEHGTPTARHTQDCVLCGACAAQCYAEAIRLSGYAVSARELAEQCLADRDVYAQSGGGVTFSGGEPLLQTDFLCDVMERLRRENVHIALETSLYAPRQNVARALRHTDLLYADIKCVSPLTHRRGTGVDNAVILDNIRFAAESGVDLVLRTPVVPNFNANDEEMTCISEFVHSLPGNARFELLAYHSMCAAKYAALGRGFPMGDTREPTREEMDRLAALAGASYRM